MCGKRSEHQRSPMNLLMGSSFKLLNIFISREHESVEGNFPSINSVTEKRKCHRCRSIPINLDDRKRTLIQRGVAELAPPNYHANMTMIHRYWSVRPQMPTLEHIMHGKGKLSASHTMFLHCFLKLQQYLLGLLPRHWMPTWTLHLLTTCCFRSMHASKRRMVYSDTTLAVL